MSDRDRELLAVANLTAAEAAALFGRTRQAVSQGLESRRGYFAAQDAVLVLNDAKRRDSDRVDVLTSFIETSYKPDLSPLQLRQGVAPLDARDLVLPNRVGQQQLLRVIRTAARTVVAFTENLEHLSAKANLAQIVSLIVSETLEGRFELVVPDERLLGYVQQRFNLASQRFIRTARLGWIPFVVTQRQGIFRAFVFGRWCVEELLPGDAEALWWQSSRTIKSANLRLSFAGSLPGRAGA